MNVWRAPVSDYTIPGSGGSFGAQMLSYAASAVAGLFLIFLVAYFLMKVVKSHDGE